MNPILREMDLLEIAPYVEGPVQIGDVIVFLPPGCDQAVVHRVAGVSREGIRTRGDNSSQQDPWLLRPAAIAGRVVAAWRGQRRRTVAGSRGGRAVAHLMCWGRALDRSVSWLLHPIYRALARGGVVRGLVPARFRARVGVFRAHGRSDMRLLLGGRVVGHYDAGRCQWHIRRPFRLFVDEPALPGGPAPVAPVSKTIAKGP